MAQTLDGFVDECIEVIRGITAIESVPDNPTGPIMVAPFGTVYSAVGADNGGPGEKRTSLDDVIIAIMVPWGTMNKWIDTLWPLRDSVPTALITKLHDSADGFSHCEGFNRISVTFGPIDWDELRMFGWLFTIEQVRRIN